MPINKSIEDLPRQRSNEGVPPSEPEFVNLLAQGWEDEYDDEEGYGRPTAIPEAGPYRGSNASIRCDRQLHYAMTLVPCPLCAGAETEAECKQCKGRGEVPLPASNPPTIADKWRFKLGKIVHDYIERLVPVVFPNDRSEVEADLRAIGIPGSAHADQVSYNVDGSPRAVVEYKSANGFGFKMAATSFKGAPEGPKFGAVLQAAMVAVTLGAPKVVVGNLALENLSPKMAESFSDAELGRFAAEWHYATEDLRPLVDYEVKRVDRIMRFHGTNLLPARELHDPSIPAGAIITDPTRGVWQVHDAKTGELKGSRNTWFCDYCPQRNRCLADGAT